MGQEAEEPQGQLVFLVVPEPLDSLAALVQLDHLVQWELQVCRALLDHLAYQQEEKVVRGKVVEVGEPLVFLDPLVLLDVWETMAPQEVLEQQDLLDLQEQLEQEDQLVQLELEVMKDLLAEQV